MSMLPSACSVESSPGDDRLRSLAVEKMPRLSGDHSEQGSGRKPDHDLGAEEYIADSTGRAGMEGLAVEFPLQPGGGDSDGVTPDRDERNLVAGIALNPSGMSDHV